MNKRKALFLALVAAVGIFAGVTARPAHATETAFCTVTGVRYETTNGGTLGILCGGAWYTSTITHSNTTCNQVIDKHKLWISMAQAAQLGGKQLKIGYNTATSECMLTTHSTSSIWFLDME